MDTTTMIQIAAGLLFSALAIFILWKILNPVKSAPNPYILSGLVFIGMVWLWNATFYLPTGQGAAEGIGADLVSIGLPVLLLWFAAKRLGVSLKQRRIVDPYKWIFGAGSFLWGLFSLVDVQKPTRAHLVGAMLQCFVFWVVALVLLIIAKKKQTSQISSGDRKDFV